jgi:Protein of unknwon function (DUF3310)
MNANQKQIGGDHYKTGGEEHWDRVHRLKLDYFQAAITKYVERCWKKNGVQDLLKAQHFLEKYIELYSLDVEGAEPGPRYVNQDPDICTLEKSVPVPGVDYPLTRPRRT